MQSALTNEQQTTVDTVRTFVEKERYPHEVEVERTGKVPAEVGQDIAAKCKGLGFFAPNISEELSDHAVTNAGLANGYYVSPAVFANCQDDMSFVRDEVFGPLMSILSFVTEEEAIERANRTHYGLSAAVFTRDFNRAHRVAGRLQAGSVWINDYNITPPEVPFGRYKQSGLGRENGLQAIEHYTRVKTVYANLGDVAVTY